MAPDEKPDRTHLSRVRAEWGVNKRGRAVVEIVGETRTEHGPWIRRRRFGVHPLDVAHLIAELTVIRDRDIRRQACPKGDGHGG